MREESFYCFLKKRKKWEKNKEKQQNKIHKNRWEGKKDRLTEIYWNSEIDRYIDGGEEERERKRKRERGEDRKKERTWQKERGDM